MTVLQAIVIGAVQGVTEFLPVSSSGHISLMQQWFGLTGDLLVFDVAVHFATFLAVIVFFRHDIVKLRLSDYFTLAVGTIPAVVVGLLLQEHFEALTESTPFVGIALLGTAAINFYSDRKLQQSPKSLDAAENFLPRQVPLKQAVLVGCAQAVAILPGISRSGSTIAGGAAVGLSRFSAFKFSFLVGMPAVLGATILTFRDVIESGMGEVALQALLAGAATAGLVGFLSLRLFALVIKLGRLEVFAWYCALVGLFALLTTQM